MDKSNKNHKKAYKIKKQKTKKKQKIHKKHHNTIKKHNYFVPLAMQQNMYNPNALDIKATGSYSPTINQELITLASIPRQKMIDCNIKEAFSLKAPLQIFVENKCYNYNTPKAEAYLLKNLKANKHIDPQNIIPPMQAQGNCWFNAMFVTFFVSDKGRKFFHFLRQLMIKGTQKNKSPMPSNLRNAFALLNFGIESSLQGTEFAYELDTNSIIFELYRQIPDSYKQNFTAIVNVNEAGNPVLYYMSIINYLNNNSIQLLFLRNVDSDWKNTLGKAITTMTHLPHIIVIEFFEEEARKVNKKPISFKVNNAKYQIDSAVVRDIEQEHFCANITCEGKEMGYDGMSFHRLVPFEWKHKMNTDETWEFYGSNHANGKPMQWNFMKSYQLLIYYRIE
jgi:hypothetical protein